MNCKGRPRSLLDVSILFDVSWQPRDAAGTAESESWWTLHTTPSSVNDSANCSTNSVPTRRRCSEGGLPATSPPTSCCVSMTFSPHLDSFFLDGGIGSPRHERPRGLGRTSRPSFIKFGRGHRLASSAWTGSAGFRTSMSSSCTTRTCAARTVEARGATSPASTQHCGATLLVHTGSLLGGSAVSASSSSGPGPTCECEPVEASPRFDSRDRLANSCCFSLDAKAQPRSISRARPPR